MTTRHLETAKQRLADDVLRWVQLLGVVGVTLLTAFLTWLNGHVDAGGAGSRERWWLVALVAAAGSVVAAVIARNVIRRHKGRDGGGSPHARDVWQSGCPGMIDWVLSGGTFVALDPKTGLSPKGIADAGLASGQAGVSAVGLPGGVGGPFALPLIAFGALTMAAGGLMGLARSAGQAKRDARVTAQERTATYILLVQVRDHTAARLQPGGSRRGRTRAAHQLRFADEALSQMRLLGYHQECNS